MNKAVSYTHLDVYKRQVVELKAVSFEPEFAGKLNFYVNAVNQLMKTDDDNPTIGLLICCLLYTSDVYKRQSLCEDRRRNSAR